MAWFFFRQPKYCLTNPRTAWATRKRMEIHRKAHPKCALTGRTPVHVHHKKSIWAHPELAADPENFISLHPKIHFGWGHGTNWKQYVENVEELIEQARIVRQKKDVGTEETPS